MPITINEKKNAPIATSVITDINTGVNTIESAAIVAMIVPNIPANKQLVFLHKHLDNGLDPVTALK